MSLDNNPWKLTVPRELRDQVLTENLIKNIKDKKYNGDLVSNKGEPRDVGSKLFEKCGKLANLKNLQKGIVQKLRKGNQYHFVLPIEDEFKASLGETTKDIKSEIYSLHSIIEELNIKSLSIAKSPHINNVLWEEILATLKIAFLNSTVKIIICIGITQYPTKEQRSQLIEEAHSSAIGGHIGVTKT